MAARDVKIVRGDNLLGTHSLGEGEVVKVEAVKRTDQDADLVNPPDASSKQKVKANELTDFVVTIGVPEAKPRRKSIGRRPKASTAQKSTASSKA